MSRIRIIILSIIGIVIIGFVVLQLIPGSIINAKFASPGKSTRHQYHQVGFGTDRTTGTVCLF